MSPILNELDNRLFDLIAEHLTPVALQPDQVLEDGVDPPDAVYFPLEGVVSEGRHHRDGATPQIAPPSLAGVYGISVLTGDAASSTEIRAQTAGVALKIGADVLRALMADNPALRPGLSRTAVSVLLARMGNEAACSGRHSLDQRLARWLLAAHSCLGSTELPVRQEPIASLLGVRRTGVSEALGRMRRARMITTGRGRIGLISLPRIAAQACECHGDLQAEFEAISIGYAAAGASDVFLIRRLFDQYYGVSTFSLPAEAIGTLESVR